MNAHVPEQFREFADAMINTARMEIARDGEMSLFVVVGSTEHKFVFPMLGVELLPPTLARQAITLFAKKHRADFILIACTIQAKSAETLDEARELSAKYERAADCPGAQQCVYVSLETYNGVYVAIKPIVERDGTKTFDDLELAPIGTATTPMVSLLPRRESDTLQ
ncbi:hypothetical protein WJ69_07275 [Burkholderia ubonensis]|nr:hypothetical protein WJ69_07275 [Burkholderia ubonensis]